MILFSVLQVIKFAISYLIFQSELLSQSKQIATNFTHAKLADRTVQTQSARVSIEIVSLIVYRLSINENFFALNNDLLTFPQILLSSP